MIAEYLERLFTWESLENTERGVAFELKNRLIEAELQGVHLAKLDGDRVPLADVTVELEDGTKLGAADITEDDPIEFPLAATVQVVLDRERLRLGTHELEIGLTVEGFGKVSFTTTDEVTEEDLVDVDPAERDADAVLALAEAVREPASLERLLDREREGPAREAVVERLEERLGEAEPLEQDPADGEPAGEQSTGDTVVDGLLADVLESPQRVSVYMAARTLRDGSPEEIADVTLLTADTVGDVLEQFEREGIAEYEDGAYEVAPPVTVLRKRSNEVWNLLRRGLREGL